MRYWVLICLPFFCTACIYAAHAEPSNILSSPQPVPCKTEASCDIDASHLENYVRSFFEWYIAARQDINHRLSTLATEERKEKDWIFSDEWHEQTKEALAPKFKDLFEKAKSSYDGEHSAPLCQDQDADVITCLFNLPLQWPEPVKARLVHIKSNKASLSVYFPSYLFGNAHVASKEILVTLSPSNGAWRFDRIEDLHIRKMQVSDYEPFIVSPPKLVSTLVDRPKGQLENELKGYLHSFYTWRAEQFEKKIRLKLPEERKWAEQDARAALSDFEKGQLRDVFTANFYKKYGEAQQANLQKIQNNKKDALSPYDQGLLNHFFLTLDPQKHSLSIDFLHNDLDAMVYKVKLCDDPKPKADVFFVEFKKEKDFWRIDNIWHEDSTK